MDELSNRRSQTVIRIQELREKLAAAENLALGKACVYMTGSFGRGEASTYSDLDLFIVGKTDTGGNKISLLNRLDEICIKADLIEVTRQLGIPEFSGEGRYLVHYSINDLIKTLGTSEDDVINTFTARLLLLLESQALLENSVYLDVIGDVIAAYWRDYEDHKTSFMPAFLANDILRLWRTFCVNYEARTERKPDKQKAKGKIKNYKLKHSRLLTCYSALLYLLALYNQNNTVSPQDALGMIKLTPTERLEWIMKQDFLATAHATVTELLDQYELFLAVTNVEENDLIGQFLDKEKSSAYMTAAYKFGDLMFEALNHIGRNSRFHRLLVV